MSRKAQTLEDAADAGYRFERTDTAFWTIKTPEGSIYHTEPEKGRCDCPATRMCKHLRWTRTLEKLIAWNHS